MTKSKTRPKSAVKTNNHLAKIGVVVDQDNETIAQGNVSQHADSNFESMNGPKDRLKRNQ